MFSVRKLSISVAFVMAMGLQSEGVTTFGEPLLGQETTIAVTTTSCEKTTWTEIRPVFNGVRLVCDTTITYASISCADGFSSGSFVDNIESSCGAIG